MSRNNIQLYFHLVFGTKYRENLIPASLHYGLYGCIWDKCEQMEIIPIAVNGTENHVHLLFKSDSTSTSAQIVNGVKGSSSYWLNQNKNLVEPFKWQRGYGLFTVSPKDVEMITNYIKKQKEHHKAGTVQNEWEE